MINSRKELGDALYTDEQVEIMNDHLAQETMAAVMKKTDVQLLVQHMQDSIREVIQPLHFEVNDQYTRSAAVAAMHEIISELHIRDHVYDYAVVCDETNNTPMSVDRGELTLDVYFKTKLFKDPIRVRGTGMSSVSAATVPVNQIQPVNDDDDIITITAGGAAHGHGFSPSVNVVSSGSGSLTGTVYGSGASNGYSVNSIQSMVGQFSVDLSYNQSPELPAVVFNGYDFDEKKIVMTLKPEATISTLEVFKILMLINAATQTPNKFSVFAFIKKNNLERHFKFAQ